MLCPIDKTALNSTTLENTVLEVCPACWGIWFSEQSFQQTVYNLNSNKLHPELEKHSVTAEHITAKQVELAKENRFTCPYDYGEMDRYPYAGDSKVIIDKCIQCGGLWIDGYELARLWAYIKPHEAKDLAAQALVEYLATVQENKEKLENLPANILLFFQSLTSPALFILYLVRLIVKTLQNKKRFN
jgi:Zn-finger nucleic acid-binding protein